AATVARKIAGTKNPSAFRYVAHGGSVCEVFIFVARFELGIPARVSIASFSRSNRVKDFANSVFRTSARPTRCTAVVNASSEPTPARTCASSSSRKWLSSSSTTASLRSRADISSRQFEIARSRSNIFLLPKPGEDGVHFKPLFALLLVRFASVFLKRVIFSFAAGLGFGPTRLDPALAFHAMEHRIEHPIGPFQLAARAVLDVLDDRVTVAFTLLQQREDERFRRSSHEFPTHHGPTMHRVTRYVNENNLPSPTRF